MAKFKPGDKVIISKDSNNVWIQGMKATVIRFLEEDNVPGNLYQWYYQVQLEDGDKSYVPQWEMKLESGTKHYCIFEITQPNILSKLCKVSSVLDYGEDYTAADKMCQVLNYLRPKNKFVHFLLRCMDQEEFDAMQDSMKKNPHGIIKVMRCKKLGGRKIPRSCHILNKRKYYCEDLFITDEESIIKDIWL